MVIKFKRDFTSTMSFATATGKSEKDQYSTYFDMFFVAPAVRTTTNATQGNKINTISSHVERKNLAR